MTQEISAMHTTRVDRDLADGVATLTMRAAPHNILNVALIDDLIDALAWSVAESARVIVLRSGLRHFCAGADLGVFEEAVASDSVPDMHLTDLLAAFGAAPIPIVASVHGICVGGGLELVLASDFSIVARSAKLGAVEATLGLHPLMGGVQRLVERAGSARAKEMAMLARRYDPETLERWNVINRVVEDDRLEAVTATIAGELAHGATVAHAATKALVEVTLEHGVLEADRRMAEIQAGIWASADLREGLRAFKAQGPGMAAFEGR